MSGSRRTYAPQLKADAIRLVLESGRSPGEVAAELKVPLRAVQSWERAARRATEGSGTSVSSPGDRAQQIRDESGHDSDRVVEMEHYLRQLQLGTRPSDGYRRPERSADSADPAVVSRRQRGRVLEERLAAVDWVDKALAVLMAEGVTSVKVPRLCTELGVTKGSFYWHFANLDELMRAVAERWAGITRIAHDALGELERLPPRQRLARMTALLVNSNYLVVERSIRNWARSDSLIAKTVSESDVHIHTLLQGALLDLGFEVEEARIRSAILVNAGIGFAQGGSPLPAPTMADIEKFYSIVVGIDITMTPM